MTELDTKNLLERYGTLTKHFLRLGGKYDVERALYCILKANEAQITGLIEEDATGHWFHKAFRQIDVIDDDDGNTDSAIWHLLQHVGMFWQMLEEWNDENSPLTKFGTNKW